jgi:hypothetical protein
MATRSSRYRGQRHDLVTVPVTSSAWRIITRRRTPLWTSSRFGHRVSSSLYETPCATAVPVLSSATTRADLRLPGFRTWRSGPPGASVKAVSSPTSSVLIDMNGALHHRGKDVGVRPGHRPGSFTQPTNLHRGRMTPPLRGTARNWKASSFWVVWIGSGITSEPFSFADEVQEELYARAGH